MKIIAVIIVCVALVSCQSRPVPSVPVETPIPSDLKISLERGPCRGTCPIYTVTVDSRGQVYFTGDRFVAFQSMMSTITQEQLQRLMAAIEVSGFFALQDSYSPLFTDISLATTTITANGKSKRIWHAGFACDSKYDDAPQALCELEDLIEEVTGTKYWIEGDATVTPAPLPTYPAHLPAPDPEETKAYAICVAQGGKWEALGFNGMGCNHPTIDDGELCADSTDCQGVCLGNLDEALQKSGLSRSSLPDLKLIEQVNRRGKVTGTCSPFLANFGCHLFVEKGQLEFICVD